MKVLVVGSGGREEYEVELELLSGDADELRRIAAKLAELPGWEFALTSKYERGLKYAGLQPAP